MKFQRRKRVKRALSMLMTAALLFTGVNFPEMFGLEQTPTVQATGITPIKVRSLADPDAITRFSTNHLTMYDIIQRYSDIEWRFGENWSGNTDDMVLTQARKYQYDRKTKTPASWQVQVIDGQCPKGDTVQIQGDTTIPENDAVQKLVALDTALVGHERVYFQEGTTIPLTGDAKVIADDGAMYHYYDLALPKNVQIPISKWVADDTANRITSCHMEQMDLTHGKDSSQTSRTMLGNQYGYLLYDDDGDGVYHRDGKWAYYGGVEFHASEFNDGDDGYNPETGGYDSIQDNYVNSPCWEAFRPNITLNFTSWIGFCAFCGQPVNGKYDVNGKLKGDQFYFYSSKDALSFLPVLNTGRGVMLECGICGGMETAFTVEHTCTGISPNIFQVRYDANGGYGYAPTTTWLTNFETEYEGNPIQTSDTGASKTINDGSGLQKEGFSFKGWSFRSDGTTVDVVPGASLLSLQYCGNGEHDAAAHTTTFQLFAVWEPETNAVTIDAQTGNTLAGTASFQSGRWNGYSLEASSTQAVYVSQTLRQSIDVEINRTNTHYPSGHQVCFSADSNNGSGTGTNLSYPSQRGIVSAASVSLYGTGSGGFRGSVTDIKAHADGSLSFRYTFGTGGYADTPDHIDVLYRQGDVTLPDITPPAGKDMLGWFTADGRYAGMPGDGYPSPLRADETLYPMFSDFKLEIEDVYYESSHTFGDPVKTAAGLSENGDENGSLSPAGTGNVKYGTGAVNLKLNMVSSPVSTDVYTLEVSTDQRNWTEITGDGLSGQEKLTDWSRTLSSAGSEVEIPQTGFYRITANGADGADYNATYKGGKGGRVSGVFFFRAGDIIRAGAVGRVGEGGDVNPATTARAENGTTLLKGGSYTQVVAYESGNRSVPTELIVAGGGGAGSKQESGGNAGGSGGDPSVTGSSFNGGGAVYIPPVSSHDHHNHTLAGCVYMSPHQHSDADGCYTNYVSRTGGSGITYDACGCSHQTNNWYCALCGRSWTTTTNGSSGCTQGHHLHDEGNSVCHSHELTCTKEECAEGHWTCGYLYSCPYHEHTNGEQNCVYQNSYFESFYGHSVCWLCDFPTIPESSQRGVGGANLIHTDLSSFVCQSSSAGSKGASDGAQGSVLIEVVNAGFLSAKNNTVTVLGYETTDRKAPREIEQVLFEADRDNGRVSWTAVENPRSIVQGNGSPYYFRASWYRATAEGMALQRQTDICEANIVSGIAGYYYICNNTPNYNIASHIVGWNGASSFTWTDSHAADHGFIGVWAASSYMDGGQKYYYVGGVCDNVSAGQSYFHIAAVDVAGNIGPTAHVAIDQAKDPGVYTGGRNILCTIDLHYRMIHES